MANPKELFLALAVIGSFRTASASQAHAEIVVDRPGPTLLVTPVPPRPPGTASVVWPRAAVGIAGAWPGGDGSPGAASARR